MGRRLRRWRRAVLEATAPIWRRPLVRQLRQAWLDFGASGGSIVAAGLAYRSLFATLTLVVFMAGVVGVVIHDPVRRIALISSLVTLLPDPLRVPLANSVDALGEAGLTIGLVGLVGLYWGASSMYDAIDESIQLVLPSRRRRSGLDRRIRGLLAMAALLAVVVAFFALAALLPAVGLGGDAVPGPFYLVAPAVAALGVVALAYAGYRFIPTQPPTGRQALAPAIVAGLAMSLVTAFFAVLAPFLVRRLAAYGVVTSVLAALIWLDLLATCFLVGAAWARARRDPRR